MAHRDAASPEGRLFDRERTVGTAKRKQLVKYVRSSLANQPASARPGRAVYRMVLSPEDARGLDLRQLTRATMAQLERDTGAKLPPWIAAEHRNTAHPHVHIVMAARREVEPGRFREVRITKPRLKLAMTFELDSQRDAGAPASVAGGSAPGGGCSPPAQRATALSLPPRLVRTEPNSALPASSCCPAAP